MPEVVIKRIHQLHSVDHGIADKIANQVQVFACFPVCESFWSSHSLRALSHWLRHAGGWLAIGLFSQPPSIGMVAGATVQLISNNHGPQAPSRNLCLRPPTVMKPAGPLSSRTQGSLVRDPATKKN